MAENNNNHTNTLLSSTLGVAKKLSHSGLEVLNKVGQNQKKSEPVDAQTQTKSALPNLSRHLLGRHYTSVNKVSSFIAPDLTDKFSDYLFEQLNHLSSHLATVDQVLDEAGVKDLEELTQDVDRSKRISEVFALQNKWLASAQGAISGATGVLGSAIDVPASVILSLRSIYQIGRAYGFELDKNAEQDVVQFIFKQIDLSLIAQKQTLLMGLKAFSSALESHDLNQLQQLLGSSQDAETLKQWLKDVDGQAKFEWLNRLPKLSILSKLTPVAGASLSAAYSWKLLEDVNHKAQDIFSEARAYLQQHGDVALSPITAYEKSRELLAEAKPKLFEQLKLNEVVKLPQHETISQVVIQKKGDTLALRPHPTDDVEQGIAKLAADLVEPHEVKSQRPALSHEQTDFDEMENEFTENIVIPSTKTKS